MKILVINGPNLNLLGVREPTIYGDLTLENLEKAIIAYGEQLGLEIYCFQSNS